MKKYKIQLTNEMIVPYGGLAMAGLMIHKTALPLRASTLKVPAAKVKISNQKVDGDALIFAYLGEEGYCVGASLGKGSDHSQKDAPAFIQESIRISRRIDPSRQLLLRTDSAHDSAHDSTDTLKICHDEQVQYLIKRNPRKERPEDWLSLAKDQGTETNPREGKKVYTGSRNTFNQDISQVLRLVYHL